jgi:hypothetical protein
MNETTRETACDAGSTIMDQRVAFAEVLAQAEIFREELASRGRYTAHAKPENRASDRLRLALELLRARQTGFENGAAPHAWCRTPASRTGAAA